MATSTWNSEGRLGLGAVERTYFVLLAQNLSEKDKHDISTRILQIGNGIDAERIAGTDGWGCVKLDTMGRVRIVTYRGAEIALLYKRQVSVVKVEGCDPVPEGALGDPNDVWLRIDLLGTASKEATGQLRHKMINVAGQLELAKKELAVKEKRIEALDSSVRQFAKNQTQLETELREAKTLSRRALAGLEDVGLEPYSPQIGSRYDNRKQEAASRVPGQSDKVGTVLGISRVGYLFKGKILVKARVSVGSKQK